MTQVLISAYVSLEEQPVFSTGVNMLLLGLENEKATVSLTLATSPDALIEAPAGTVRLVSLQTELTNLDTPWPEVEQTLRDRFAALAETGDPVLIATIFRLVDRTTDEGHARLVRIRRLNLLATDLSREFGAFVVDIDRVMADVGGVVLNADYRLQGEGAAELAGQAIAAGISTNALDAFLPFEAQERVTAHVNARQSVHRQAVDLMPPDLMNMGKGRRRQRVSTITDAVQENHVSWQVKQLLAGKISLVEAANKLIMAIRRRGLKESLGLLTSGIFRVMNKKATT